MTQLGNFNRFWLTAESPKDLEVLEGGSLIARRCFYHRFDFAEQLSLAQSYFNVNLSALSTRNFRKCLLNYHSFRITFSLSFVTLESSSFFLITPQVHSCSFCNQYSPYQSTETRHLTSSTIPYTFLCPQMPMCL